MYAPYLLVTFPWFWPESIHHQLFQQIRSASSVPVCLTWPYTSTPTTLPRRNHWGCPKNTETPKNPRVNHHFFLIKCFCFLDIIYILHQSHSDCISWWVKRGLKGGLLVTCLSFFVFKMVSRIWQTVKCHKNLVLPFLFESHSFQRWLCCNMSLRRFTSWSSSLAQRSAVWPVEPVHPPLF